MKFSSLSLIAGACAATLIASQALIPTAKAQPVPTPNYRLTVNWQKTERSLSGLMITGGVTNTGSKPLTYTQVVPVLFNASGKAVWKGSGYLTVSPLQPGQSAEFRACETDAPRFASLHVSFGEVGQPVVVEEAQPAQK